MTSDTTVSALRFPGSDGHEDRVRFAAISVGIYVASLLAMAYLRLVVFPASFVTLTYGLPLLLCLWHRDTRLLWAMAVSFLALAAFKAFVWLPEGAYTPDEVRLHFVQQVANILAIGGTVHVVIRLARALADRNRELARRNAELVARDAEIVRQNDELLAQAEELAQQNEEIQQQSEEVSQQAEELQGQAEELQAAYTEAERREALLQALIESLRQADDGGELPADICRPLLSLFEGKADGAVVAERRGERFHVLSHVNMVEYADGWRTVEGSFGGIVMAEGRTAAIEDLRTRGDIHVVPTGERTFRSALATPLRVDGAIVGVVEVVSTSPQRWSKADFRIIEWVAAQCALVMQTRRLRDALRTSNVRLDGEVQERTRRLQDSVNELEHFSYTITHDLRAPLRAMQGFAALLGERLDGTLDAEGRDFLARIGTAARRMDRLITDALSYSRIVREELPLAPVDLRGLIAGMLASYPAFQPPAALVTVDPLPRVLANEAGLTQLFSNLLGNAVKFVPAGVVPRVRVHGARHGDRVRVCVEDNGIGIAPEMHERVFEMFQRASKEYDGTGIGLALVRKIAERMGGAVTLESEPGRGSRFWVELRAAGPAEERTPA